MKSLKKAIWALPLAFLIAGCQSNPSQSENSQSSADVKKPAIPDWVAQPPAKDSLDRVVVTVPIEGKQSEAMLKAKMLAKQTLAKRLESHYQAQLQQLRLKQQQSWGVFEVKVREAVRANLPSVATFEVAVESVYIDDQTKTVSALAVLNKDAALKAWQARYQQLDGQLMNYIHVSEKGSHLKQLIALMPVVKILEEQVALQAAIQTVSGEKPKQPYQKLASAYEDQLVKLFDNFAVSLEALEADADGYDVALTEALIHNGLNISAMMPDLNIRYYVETERKPSPPQSNMRVVSVTGDYEMVNEIGNRFAVLNLTTQGRSLTEKQAVQEALALQAKPIVNTVIDKLINADSL